MATSKHREGPKKVDPEPEASSSGDSSEDGVESIIEEFDGLPKDAKQIVKKLAISEFGMMGIGHLSQENEVAKKINATHITSYLEGAREQMQHEYKEQHERKIYNGILVFGGLAFLLLLIVLLQDKPDILEKIIYSVTSFVAGAFGGYGLGKQKGSDD